MKRLEAADMRIGARVDPQEIKLGEILELERGRIRLLLKHRIIPVKPAWWDSDKLGLYPVRLLKKFQCQ